MSRLLVTGASGYLGSHVAMHAVAAGHQVTGTYLRHAPAIDGIIAQRLDISDREAVHALVCRTQPTHVVHCAVGAPDDWRTNAEGAVHMALAARAIGARLVHVSSDAIFSGGAEPYTETALPSPITVYGASKAAAETAVAAIDADAAIARTSLIIGDGACKHVEFVLRLLNGSADGALFTDEMRCPVAVTDLAAALIELAHTAYRGVLNLAGADAVSRYDLGVLIARRYGYDPAVLRAGLTADSGLRRPTAVRLDSTCARTLLQTPLRGVGALLAPELVTPAES